MEKFILKIISFFQPIFVKMGLDYEQIISIIKIKLKIDNRRNYAIGGSSFGQVEAEQTEKNNSFIKTLWIYLFFGLILAFILYFAGSLKAFSSFYGALIYLIAMMLLSDFSSILLDTQDNSIILPKPVDSKTLYFARILHITLYLLQINFAFSLLPTIAVAIKFGGLLAFAFFILTFFAIFFTLFISTLFYLLILKFSNEERVKDILNYAQIAFTMFFIVGYQVVPRVFEHISINTTSDLKWWAIFVPPMWYGVTLQSILEGTLSSFYLYALLAIFLPILLVLIQNKYLSKAFSSNLGAMDANAKIKADSKNRTTFMRWLSTKFTSDSTEKMGFNFVWLMTARDRKFKLRTYPQMTSSLIILVPLLSNLDSKDLQTPVFLFIYSLALITLPFTVSFYDTPDASWVFNSNPLSSPGRFMLGSYKSYFVKFGIFPYLLFCIPFIVIWSPKICIDLVVVFLNIAIFYWSYVSVSENKFPFSELPSTNGNTEKGLVVIAFMFGLGFVGFVHYYLYAYFWIVIPILIPIQILIIYLLMRNLVNKKWAFSEE